MPGILYVVATPIGNLEDVTFRALRILREVSLIAAEDTRRTAKLLQHYSITTRTTSLHEHNERQRTPLLIERLKRGESIALVSDAGTPVLSDPGVHLVAAAHREGITVDPIPGPSAAMAAVSAAGIAADRVLFVGFPPVRATDLKRWLTEVVAVPAALVIFEAPHRIARTLAALAEVAPERQLAVGRELTKAHGFLGVKPTIEWRSAEIPERGEFTLVLGPPVAHAKQVVELPAANVLADQFGELTNKRGLNRRDAVKALAEKYGLDRRAMYSLIEATKQ